MEPTYTIVMMGMMLFIIGMIPLVYLQIRRYRYVSIRSREIRTKSTFGEARHILSMMIANGRIDPREDWVKRFYRVQTVMMRNPSNYKQISLSMSKALLHGPSKDPDNNLRNQLPPELMIDYVRMIQAMRGAYRQLERYCPRSVKLQATVFYHLLHSLNRTTGYKLSKKVKQKHPGTFAQLRDVGLMFKKIKEIEEAEKELDQHLIEIKQSGLVAA
ncbi:hypothetical protein [Phaeocystidibacter luteus]|uniref:Uncharacterized protein n=1 Tax=Phaeocystidibacter luteus TaxID=911197 RepID=A0A6N6RLW1_9FLAO|nr:hypothetical protein [Phaeocystidibacter luteus]KAB2814551.1 hypothetical protein F8C67_02090 [Phaeocystidibacter luteus]